MNIINKKILKELMLNARVTWKEIARKVKLSDPAVSERVSKLEEKKIIKGYSAIVDRKSIGLEMTAFITLSISLNSEREAFLNHISKLPEVLECHHIAGEDDYILKVCCRDTADLDRIISKELRQLPGVDNTKTRIVLNSHKETTFLPID